MAEEESVKLAKLIRLIALFGLLHLPALADFNAGLKAYEEKNYATALKEWKPLAERGDARAQNNLGVMYLNGECVRRDYEEARMWLRMADAQGDDTAKLWLKAIEGYVHCGDLQDMPPRDSL